MMVIRQKPTLRLGYLRPAAPRPSNDLCYIIVMVPLTLSAFFYQKQPCLRPYLAKISDFVQGQNALKPVKAVHVAPGEAATRLPRRPTLGLGADSPQCPVSLDKSICRARRPFACACRYRAPCPRRRANRP